MGTSTGVPAALASLSAAVGVILDADPADFNDQALLDLLKQVRPLTCRVQAAQTRLVGAVHARGATSAEGAVSTQSWLRNRLRMGEAGVSVRAAATMARLSLVAAAFEAGEISLDHVETIGAVARDLSDEVLAAGAEKLLVEQACELAPHLFAKAAARIRDHFAPDTAEKRARRRLQERWLTADRTLDGCVSLSGMLDPDGGELLLSTLGALMPPPRLDDQRSAGMRRADALLDLCALAGDHAPQAGGEKPHVVVTIDHQRLAGQLPGGGVLGSGWPVPAETVRRLACDCGVIPLLLGSNGQPLDIGTLSRSIPPPMRRALVHRDQGCRFPHCDRPAAWCDAHHVNTPWARGGKTALRNLILACRHHHTLLHEGGWTAHLDPDTGIVTVTRPDGIPFDTVSHPRSQGP